MNDFHLANLTRFGNSNGPTYYFYLWCPFNQRKLWKLKSNGRNKQYIPAKAFKKISREITNFFFKEWQTVLIPIISNDFSFSLQEYFLKFHRRTSCIVPLKNEIVAKSESTAIETFIFVLSMWACL